MQTRNQSRPVLCAAVILLAGIFYFYQSYLTVGGFGVGYQYIGCILVILLGFGCFLAKPDPLYLYHAIKGAGVLALSYLAAMLCTAAIWIFTFTPVRQMISGFFEPSYMILCIVCAAFFVYLARERAAEYAFWALSAVLGVMVLRRIRAFGAGEFFRRLAAYLQSGGVESGGVSVEDTSFAYLYALFALYFLFSQREDRAWRRWLRGGVTVFALAIAFKRSALLALAFGAAAAYLYDRLPQSCKKLFRNGLIVGFILCAFGIVPLIRSGLFRQIVDALQINTSARTRIYAYYEQHYQFALSYTGKGLGWVQRLVSSAERFNTGLQSVNVHCDYLRFYIELGFAGYLLWLVTVFPLVVGRAVGAGPSRSSAVILGVCVAMAVLRVTENISELYSANLVVGILVIQCGMSRWSGAEHEPPEGSP